MTRGLDGSTSEPPHWSRWFRLIGVPSREGEVVMKGADDRPLLLLDRKGEGRVGMLLSDQGWLWARGFEGGGPHADALPPHRALADEGARARGGALTPTAAA